MARCPRCNSHNVQIRKDYDKFITKMYIDFMDAKGGLYYECMDCRYWQLYRPDSIGYSLWDDPR